MIDKTTKRNYEKDLAMTRAPRKSLKRYGLAFTGKIPATVSNPAALVTDSKF